MIYVRFEALENNDYHRSKIPVFRELTEEELDVVKAKNEKLIEFARERDLDYLSAHSCYLSKMK